MPCNSMQHHAIPCNTMQYHALPCNTMQYNAIPCNTVKHNAIPCININCWRSVPLPCGQYNAIFIIYANDKSGGVHPNSFIIKMSSIKNRHEKKSLTLGDLCMSDKTRGNKPLTWRMMPGWSSQEPAVQGWSTRGGASTSRPGLHRPAPGTGDKLWWKLRILYWHRGQAFRYVFDTCQAGVLVPVQRIEFWTQLLWRHERVNINSF